ncbi:MAG TPA: hypothetical protein PKA77_04105 [Chitinophagaceae bacterium]|nr:hypothetical protein [Chitinophagaceae bacterium]HMU57698.1 hypothetical protein [Chitinophagaceae bacterium]
MKQADNIQAIKKNMSVFSLIQTLQEIMITNTIQDIRADVVKYFDEGALLADTEEIHFSPDNRYYFKSNYYRQTDKNHNWIVSKIQVFQTDNNQEIFEFIRNDDSLFHGWLTTSGKSYLFLSEDIEGKSILDLSDGSFYSYSFEDDTFIWCEYYPSPDGKRLAVIGCYWACPYEILVFDTSEPTRFPFKELYRHDTFQEKLEWLDNVTLKISGNTDSKIVVIE